MTGTLASRLHSYLRHHQGRMIALLKDLATAESPATDPASHRTVLGLLRAELVERRMKVRDATGAGGAVHLLAVPKSRAGEPFQLLLGHADTVWPVGTLESMPIRQRGRRLSGPGVYDMKGGLVQGLFAIEALAACEIELPVTPVLFINTDEEIGSGGSTRHLVRLARRADRVFVLEPSLGPDGRLKTARKGVGHFKLRVLGRAAHAGLEPEKGASAILELSLQIQRLFALNDPRTGISVNVGTIDGGLRPNVVAPESTASVEVRVRTRAQAVRIEREIRALQPTTPNTKLVVEGGFGRPPMERTPANARLWRLAKAAAAELGIELEQDTAGGASDGNTTSQFVSTLDGLGPVGGGAHAEDEHVDVDRMVERAALLGLLLAEPPLRRPGHTPGRARSVRAAGGGR